MVSVGMVTASLPQPRDLIGVSIQSRLDDLPDFQSFFLEFRVAPETELFRPVFRKVFPNCLAQF